MSIFKDFIDLVESNANRVAHAGIVVARKIASQLNFFEVEVGFEQHGEGINAHAMKIDGVFTWKSPSDGNPKQNYNGIWQ